MELLTSIEQSFGPLEQPTLAELRKAIASLRDCLHQVPDYATEPGALPYGRHVLYRSTDVEVIVIHVPGGRRTTIHDHADSIGCAIVVEGELENQLYTLDAEGFPVPRSSYTVRQGECLEAPHGQIHELINPRQERMISLHAYAPPLSGVKRYAPYSEVLDFVI